MSFNQSLQLSKKYTRGFSLLEVLITAAIIGIVTAIVVVKYGAFNSSVLLKNHAYEIALALREAQVFSVSIRGEGNIFRDRYGVYVDISSGSASELILFLDTTANAEYDDAAEPSPDQVIETLVLDSRFEVSDVCVTTAGPIETCGSGGIDDLSVTFGRPDFDARFIATGIVAGPNDILSATIELTPVTGSAISQIITIHNTGQISVQTSS
ncbi:prepilin-type N-terminal cleavage/methylation domain-containing protein [Candidatus Pacebacteria bacterium]|nr:prepilin-type N-terminal cleavage/methylation domain-containing protein [Candidatus Paceibacterota bacterium]